MLQELVDALDPEYEYAWATDKYCYVFYDTREDAEEFMGNPKQFKRLKPGKWEEVDSVE